ncbi:hypothetical protein ZWY2020_024990 [Hordeum vulgare]|nr:hypothetical protein ZWY2020_024990 [Hordeum vulgare]
MLAEEDIVNIVKKQCGETIENCSKIVLKPFCISNPAPEKNSPFYKRRSKTVKKTTKKAAPKKKKTKGKATTKESSIVGESRAAEEHSEDDDMESQDEDIEVISISSDSNSSPPRPTRRVCRKVPLSHPDAHLDPKFLLKKASFTPKAKKRKTVESSSTPKAVEIIGMSASISEARDEPAETYAEAPDDFPDIQDELPSPQKETTESPNPPSPQKAAKDVTPDPDPVFVVGTGYSKPASVVLTKHVPKDAPILVEKGMTKLKLPNFEKVEFDELYSGFLSRLETSHEMEKSLVNMMKRKHKADSTVSGLRQSLAEQQDARAKFEEKLRLALVDIEKMKADHKELEEKAEAE